MSLSDAVSTDGTSLADKLVDELCYERQMNALLDTFRDYALVLMSGCRCDSNQQMVTKLKQLNAQIVDRKTTHRSRPHLSTALTLPLLTTETNGKPTVDPNSHKCHDCHQSFTCEDQLLLHLNRCHTALDSNGSQSDLNDNKGSAAAATAEANGQSIQSFLNNLSLESVNQKTPKSVSPKRNLRSTRKRSLPTPRQSKDNGSKYFKRSTPKSEVKPPIAEPLECPECHKSMASATALEIHTNKEHLKAQPFVCVVCLKEFFANLSLLNHMSQKHKISSFECQNCEYKARTKHHLIQHQVTHSTDRPFECDVEGCYLRFKRKDLLSRHQMLMHC